MDENEILRKELVQVARLASENKNEDLRLYLARLARRFRRDMPDLSSELANLLETATHEPARASDQSFDFGQRREDDALPLLRISDSTADLPAPVLPDLARSRLNVIIEEWRQADTLLEHGLRPISSAIFTGAPGVGKTYTARWLATQLELPLFSLDLTAVMSSRLGQSGANLRSALDYARRAPCVLFLDEVDSIAKRRADDSDVGELKRLVTIMLQELDAWPSTSLLLAATNHPELVDPALWRRFDLQIEFPMPDDSGVEEAIVRYLGDEVETLRNYLPTLRRLLGAASFSDIERSMSQVRKKLVLGGNDLTAPLEEIARISRDTLSRGERISIATELQKSTAISQHQISRLMGVSRDTIRKHGRATQEVTHA